MMLRWRVGADTQRSWSSGTQWRHSQDMSKDVKMVISLTYLTWNLVSASNTSSCLFLNMTVKVVKWIWLWQGFRNSTSIENLSCTSAWNPASPTLRKTLRSCWTTMRRKRSHMKRYANCKWLLKIDVCLWWPFETKKWCLFESAKQKPVQELLLVLELCDEGSLSDFLVKHLKAVATLRVSKYKSSPVGKWKCEDSTDSTWFNHFSESSRVGVLVTKNVLCWWSFPAASAASAARSHCSNARWVRQLLSAVKHCHDSGLVHNDLKFDNIMCLDENKDLGLLCQVVAWNDEPACAVVAGRVWYADTHSARRLASSAALPKLKLIDFGNAQSSTKKAPVAPELLQWVGDDTVIQKEFACFGLLLKCFDLCDTMSKDCSNNMSETKHLLLLLAPGRNLNYGHDCFGYSPLFAHLLKSLVKEGRCILGWHVVRGHHLLPADHWSTIFSDG